MRLGRLLALAAAVRVAYVASLLALDAALPDYDTSSSLLSPDCGAGWPRAAAAVHASPRRASGLAVWDAVFFHRLAACGYEYEQFYAFFPGLPGAARRAAAGRTHCFSRLQVCCAARLHGQATRPAPSPPCAPNPAPRPPQASCAHCWRRSARAPPGPALSLPRRSRSTPRPSCWQSLHSPGARGCTRCRVRCALPPQWRLILHLFRSQLTTSCSPPPQAE